MTKSSYLRFSETHNAPSNLQFQNLSKDTQQLIKDALRLLIHIFWSKDGKKNWAELVQTSKSVWVSLQNVPELGLDLAPALQDINRLLSSLSTDELQTELESEFVRLFINTRGGISASLFHSYYYDEHNLLMNKPATEMAQLLEDIEMGTGPEMGDPPDHLCVELEYLLFLLEHCNHDADKDLVEHIHIFACKFMLPWVSEFQKRIPAGQPASFFSQKAMVLKQLLIIIGKE